MVIMRFILFIMGLSGLNILIRGGPYSSLIVILPSILLSMKRCLMMLSIIASRVFMPIS